MHFFKNSVSFIAVMCVFGAACAATTNSRVGVITGAASRRLPSLASISGVRTISSTTDTTSTSTGTIVLSDTECVENYRDCMKAESACGPEFEECTTNVLFHGHMSECFSTLYQCSSAAINDLFGTSNLAALSTVKSYVDGTVKKDSKGNIIEGEVARYTYPTDGSVMGMDIIGAATRNRLSTADCVKKYKRCLNKDNVCGEDFELCTTDTEFKKQAPMCDSTLSRCQKEGFQQLFGDKQTVKPVGNQLKPMDGGAIRQWVDEGATLAAANAVNTCYKVVDNCFANACAKNPYRCIDGVSTATVDAAESVTDADNGTLNVTVRNDDGTLSYGTTTATDVRRFFRAACESTIGENKYCQMTFLGRMPTKAELKGEDAQDLVEEIFDDAYATRNNKNILGEKVSTMIQKFDTDAKNKCIDTFKSCAVRSCGGGSGAVCYSRVFGQGTSLQSVNDMPIVRIENAQNTINGTNTYNDIKSGCAGVVNMDKNCIYMATVDTDAGYTYDFDNSGVFGKLFPRYTGGVATQPIVVTALNAELSTAYNAVAIEQLKKQCQNVVSNCVTSMCGKDYQNCYRNRSDVTVNVYNSDNASFNQSMNQVGGILDYTIIQGLCASTVTSSDACAESLAIAKADIRDGTTDVTGGWQNAYNNTLSSAWRSTNNINTNNMVAQKDANGRDLCQCADGTTEPQVCGYAEGGNANCTTPYKVSVAKAIEDQAVGTIFKEVLTNVESHAQAVYKAKLTKEQSICMSQQGSTANPNPPFVWARLANNNKISDKYETYGLGANGSVPSNDLYGSFCRVMVTLHSEDQDIQKLLNGDELVLDELAGVGIAGGKKAKTTIAGRTSGDTRAYFAVGDAFTCGSWVSNDTLDAISKKVNYDAQIAAGRGSQSDKNARLWTTLGLGTAGTLASYFGMNAIQNNPNATLGGLLKKNNAVTDRQRTNAQTCITNVDRATDVLNTLKSAPTAELVKQLQTYEDTAVSAARTTKMVDVSDISFGGPVITTTYEWKEGMNTLKTEWQNCLSTITGNTNEDVAQKRYINQVIGWFDAAADTAVKQLSSIVSVSNNVTKCDSVAKIANKIDTYFNTTYTNVNEWKKQSVYDPEERSLKTLLDRCQKVVDTKTTERTNGQRLTANIAAGVFGGAATTLLANGIMATTQRAQYENAGDDAVKEWMDDIGSKIHCYVGGQKVADFGQTISIDITED